MTYACSGERSEETGTEDAGQNGIDQDAGPGDGTADGSDGGPDGGDGEPSDLDAGLDASPGDGDAGSGDGDAGAGDGDAGGDGDGEPADGTGLIVTVLVNGVPYEGQGVTLFDGAGDTAPTTYRTDAQGRVAVATARSIVTIAPIPDDVPVQAVGMPVTYFAVEEGDRLILNYPAPTQGVLGQYQITTAGAADGFSYQALAGTACSVFIESPNTLFEMNAYGSCLDETNDVLSYALSGGIAGCSFAKDVPRPADNTVAVTLPPYGPLGETELSLANFDGIESVSSRLEQVSGKAHYGSDAPSESDITVAPVPYGYCPGFSDALEASLSFRDGSTTRTLRQRGAEADAFAFDYQTILPRIDILSVVGNDDGLTITTTAPVTDADVGLFTVGWDVFNGETFDFYPWLLIVPPDTTELSLPQHPDGFEGTLRAAGGGFVDVGSQAGYTASKQQTIEAASAGDDGMPSFVLTGASDTLRTTSLITSISTRIIAR